MRKLLIVLICLISSYAYAEKVIVSYKPDGKVYYTYGKGDYVETHAEEIVNRSDALKNLPYDLIDSSQLPDRADRDYWVGEKGKGVKVDVAKKNADKTAKENKIKDINDKLNAIGLTAEDIKLIR